ncbi:MAG TPA: hypothetical protein VGG97_28805 [Bryobacteraceae bacterium]|jgi:predicted nucleic acid-binding protein
MDLGVQLPREVTWTYPQRDSRRYRDREFRIHHCCAVEANSQCIVNEDKHLLRLGECEGIKIVRARDFLELGRVGRVLIAKE